MHGLKSSSYIDRLAKLGIDSFQRRRLNKALMLRYELKNNLCDSSISNLFKPGSAVTRGDGFKLNPQAPRERVPKHRVSNFESKNLSLES